MIMGAVPLRDTISVHGNIAEPDNSAAHQDPAPQHIVSEVERHRRALEENPGDVDTILRAAWFCQDIGRMQEASALFVQAMNLAPNRPEGFVGMSRILLGQEMHSEAVDLLKDAIARNHASAPLWREIARVMSDLDRVDSALTFYDEALRLAPDHIELQLERAAYLKDHGRLSKA
jgi:cytochrome c-type biogenesis protein CcmH/NrfG